MRRCPFSLCFAVLVLTTLGVAFPQSGSAQETPQDLVPFKATLTGPPSNITFRVVIPVEPPLIFVSLSLAGEASFLGQSTWIEHHIGQIGADGVIRSQEGVGVLSSASGDALFVRWSGLIRDTPSALTGEHGFVVTGGRGRFLGATGSGVLTQDYGTEAKPTITYSWDGKVSRPKP